MPPPPADRPPGPTSAAGPIPVTADELRARPLPDHGSDTTKHDRGSVLVVGGSAETPGAVLLAGLAALRAGAGRLRVATAESVSAALAVALPEARIVSLPEAGSGGLDPGDATLELLRPLVAGSDAVLVGSGALDAEATGMLLGRIVPEIDGGVLVVDAGALPVLADAPDLLLRLGDRAVVMPNPGEMATLLGRSIDAVTGDPAAALADAVGRLGVVVTLRGAETWTGAPGETPFADRSGDAGLATSGSGDVLAGLIAGLAARGADGVTAAVWASYVHAAAGQRCAARVGTLGYLARELLDEVPAVLGSLGP